MSDAEHPDPAQPSFHRQPATRKPPVPRRLPTSTFISTTGPLAIDPAAPGAIGNPPSRPDVAGQIPLAAVLSYENIRDYYDTRTRGWLITAGILWIITGIAPMIVSVMGVFVLITELSPTRSRRAEPMIELLLIPISMLMVGSALSYTLGVACFLRRRWITHLAPAWGLLLLTFQIVFATFTLDTLIRYSLQSISNEKLSLILAIFFLPMAIFGLLTFAHLRRGTIAYLRAYDHRNSPTARRKTLTAYLVLASLMICPVTAMVAILVSQKGTNWQVEANWFLPMLISALICPILAVTTWLHLKLNRILGAAIYAYLLVSIVTDQARFFGHESAPRWVLGVIVILLCYLHAFNRSQPADPNESND